jgi:two-component system response regulator LytT
MNIVIVEDETLVARRIKMFIEQIIEGRVFTISVFHDLDDAENHIENHKVDVLFLDLNLNNKNGFDLLKGKVFAPFHTIIVSASTNKALDAFEYGAIDFVAKPFKKERVETALKRVLGIKKKESFPLKYLTIKKYGRIETVNIASLLYIRSSGHYSELHINNGKIELHEKSLESLLQLLPDDYFRVHKSFILSLERIVKLHKHPGSRYELELDSGDKVPLGRTRYTEIKGILASR